MPENKPAQKKAKRGLSVPPLAIVVIASAVVGGAVFWFLNRPGPKPTAPALTGPAKVYVRNLRLSGVEMQKHESYLGQGLVEITGSIGNAGDRVLKTVEINLVFYDPYGQIVLRERRAIVDKKMNGLAPNETKQFRLAFDNIPDGWNQALPQLVIAAIDFS